MLSLTLVAAVFLTVLLCLALTYLFMGNSHHSTESNE
ncbi:hypothetical protein CQP30_20575 [Yersinia pestis]|uniref:Uncharacterized protein n=2 Tax=Yersinia pseudotuberculosis complex TaxID=1649845 RepID=A0A384LC74_YERPE|nr:hypothetical protein BAY22_01365 [Yersinia pestis]AYW90490.1 hypothetical protein EGX47_03495 [Yersinia pseudotuberculosis]EDM39911.1 hypothetical protein YPE_2729 [Yersinia pestis CA88-4125]KJG82954.1 hypothetical protein RN23_19520 [Yersinia pestis subsp. microtus bv. Ulegeica]KKM53190.1 hypothetical protein KD37_01945 [Yersinia pestis subsp. pestis bv. Orientalis]KPD38560.1 hypothetical protein AC473_20825 [Yersinia pestis subsp. microtus bv. Caucasica]KPD50604.1 hypothetical protein AC